MQAKDKRRRWQPRGVAYIAEVRAEMLLEGGAGRGADLAGVPTSPPVPSLTFTANRTYLLESPEAFALVIFWTAIFPLLLSMRLRFRMHDCSYEAPYAKPPPEAQLPASMGDTMAGHPLSETPKEAIPCKAVAKLLRKYAQCAERELTMTTETPSSPPALYPNSASSCTAPLEFPLSKSSFCELQR